MGIEVIERIRQLLLRNRSRCRQAAGALALAVLAVPASTSAIQGFELRSDPLVTPNARLASFAPGAASTAGPLHPIAGGFAYGSFAGRFGASRPGHVHAGQDIFAATGTPLIAVRDGIVLMAQPWSGYGNFLAVYSPEADETYLYAHMVGPALVAAGERVRAGQRVGAVGCTGSCWGPHLHFELRRGRGPRGIPVDPLPALLGWPRVRL